MNALHRLGRSARVSFVILPLALAACTDTPPVQDPFKRAFDDCLRLTEAPGTYLASVDETRPSGSPVIKPGAGGTTRGAVLMEACVESQLLANGPIGTVVRAPTATPQPDGRNVGGLPLPTQYPLLPGDAELWPTLTRAQQQRAMQFLANGSTIRSSLKADR